MSETHYQHWRLEVDAENVLWLWMDRQGSSVNSLSREVFDEFDAVIAEIIQRAPSAVILGSGKEKGFIAGADITQFSALKNTEEAFTLIRQAQLVLDKFEALPMPTVAMIRGFCLGGGCEVALSCTYRVAEDIPSTRIGLPEVKLGIQPGWGGTVRMPALIGAPAAMSIMLPGADLSASKAYKIGLVDACVPTRELKRAAHYFATKKPPRHRPKGLAYWSNAAWLRPILGKMMLKKLAKKVREEHYPAPFAIVRQWMKEGIGRNAYIAEAQSISKLLLTNTSRHLVHVFFLQNRLKALAKNSKFKPQHVHVIGAGTMGGDIAAWCAYKGLYVSLQDQSPERIAPAIKRAYAFYNNTLKNPRLVQAALDRLQPDIQGNGIRRADVVIEAVFEDLAVKQEIFKKLEAQLKPGAILATNTSSIPLDEINVVLKNPDRLVGIHFFNPVSKMQLVEVVHGCKTSSEVLNDALAFVGAIGRLPLPVQATPGFLVNRILMPYLLEAMKIYEEGVAPELIDKIALDFGMPMGPITLADTVGLDVCLSVAKILTKYYGGSVPQRLEQMVAEGQLGCKTGVGFYRYANGKKISTVRETQGLVQSDLIDRMILVMVNEAVVCLEQKIVEDADLLDIGMIFGTGFAPFTGGPIHYVRQRGWKHVKDRLQVLADRYGDRFKPVNAWNTLFADDASFAPENAAISVENHESRVAHDSDRM